MNLCNSVCFVALLTLFSACGLTEKDETHLLISSIEYDFDESDHGWVHGFADYPSGPDDSTYYQLQYAYTDLPVSSGDIRKSHMLSGYNHSKGLFMYLKKQVDGLSPNTDYTITFSIELALDLSGNIDIGSGVYLKAGATHPEPKSVIESGYYVMNIDKGNQSGMGEDLTTLGEIVPQLNSTGYSLNTKTNTMSNARYVAKSDSKGMLWLIIGTDSNVEGITKLFYTKVNVVFSAS